MLARSWAECDKLTLHLPPSRLAIEPGSAIQLPLNPPLWTVERASTDGFVVVAELRPSSNRAAAVTAEPGRVASSPDVVAGPVALALADLPDVTGTSANEPFILLAASSASAGWKPKTAEITFGGQSIATRTARIKSVLGEAASALPAAACELIDQQNSVEVVLVDPDQWLTSCDDAGLGAGDNLALLGAELIQFGVAAPLGDGRFRLSRLLRGRGGSEWACSGHAAGDAFCLLQPGALEAIALPRWAIGSSVTVALAGASASISFGGEALRPPSPVDLIGERLADGSLKLSWIRRSRQGFAWIDGVDAPLGETFEQYRITLTGNSGVLESTAAEPAFLISATEVSSVGPGPAVIEVRQIGDFAVSRTAQLNIDLN
jgi:hypothetical protein